HYLPSINRIAWCRGRWWHLALTNLSHRDLRPASRGDHRRRIGLTHDREFVVRNPVRTTCATPPKTTKTPALKPPTAVVPSSTRDRRRTFWDCHPGHWRRCVSRRQGQNTASTDASCAITSTI